MIKYWLRTCKAPQGHPAVAGRFAPVGKLAPANALCKPDDNPWKAPKHIFRKPFEVV